MEKSKTYVVITSINAITDSVVKFSAVDGCHVVVVGDLKSRPYSYSNTTFLDVDMQLESPFASASSTPFNHYSRKNLGYLFAIKNKALKIFDTDDDTFPYKSWGTRDFCCENSAQISPFVNSFALFTEEFVWPRGTPLSFIKNKQNNSRLKIPSQIGVWQGLIDDDSDFDSVYRLTNGKYIKFNNNSDVAVQPFCFSPFNSQSTLWNPTFYPLLYLPTTVDFRFTDILRSYISQRIMWEFGYCVGFHAPNTYQQRNQHDYFKDFLGEISMFQALPELIAFLNSVNISGLSIKESLIAIYAGLLKKHIVKDGEIINLNNWIKDLNFASSLNV